MQAFVNTQASGHSNFDFSQRIQADLREYIITRSESQARSGLLVLSEDEDRQETRSDAGKTEVITPEPAPIAQIASEIHERLIEDKEDYVKIATPTVRFEIAQYNASFICAYLVSE